MTKKLTGVGEKEGVFNAPLTPLSTNKELKEAIFKVYTILMVLLSTVNKLTTVVIVMKYNKLHYCARYLFIIPLL